MAHCPYCGSKDLRYRKVYRYTDKRVFDVRCAGCDTLFDVEYWADEDYERGKEAAFERSLPLDDDLEWRGQHDRQR